MLVATQYLPRLRPDTKYVLTYFVRAEGLEPGQGESGQAPGAFVNIWAARGWNSFFPMNGHHGTFAWTKQSVSFETPPDAGRDKPCYIRMTLRHLKGKAWFDDVRIRAVPR